MDFFSVLLDVIIGIAILIFLIKAWQGIFHWFFPDK
jgi:hypothetical protein